VSLNAIDKSRSQLGIAERISSRIYIFRRWPARLRLAPRPKTTHGLQKTLAEISQLMLRNVLVLYEAREKRQPASAEERKLYDDVRTLHARLLSSANSIPRFARPALQALGLLQPRAKIEEGARMLIGISNQLLTANKDLPHLTELIKKLGGALDIAV
jgi:hypothetical protein